MVSQYVMMQAMDTDGNGRLDAGEFRNAMQKLGMTNITGTTVGTIMTAMNIHGPITMEEFLQIVDVRAPICILSEMECLWHCASFSLH